MTQPDADPATPADPLTLALARARAGRVAALCAVVGTWGSSPRPAGSLLFTDEDGHVEGSVSGGCVETDVILAAQDAMTDGQTRLLQYGVTSDRAWEVGLACGGKLDVLVQAVGSRTRPGTLDLATLEQLAARREARQAAALAIDLSGAPPVLVTPDALPTTLPADVRAAAGRALQNGMSVRVADGTDPGWFVHAFVPRPRLLIVGAVHIAQALAVVGRQAGFDVAVIDPRGALATQTRFPGIPLLSDWPDVALAELGIDAQTAIVTLTHDAKLDDPALLTALASPAFYIGALGSRKTQASRIERLREHGVSDDAIARMRGPVGLAIGALGASEIALSIMAEIIAVRRGAPLAERRGW
ncbi:xanthine dehydrogenase accessory factor XdhC/CoxI [Ameyamaea chiangmaiensis NBRC 103196]|uniref:XdhC family protein n=1 Tax=Ameyamaea chiangmaiensis TaxID=442969 RepID=A0A850PJT7_9PROT|nr:XdhC/CoxI family protein [Ameyamaea chiangmaiensis]MBS4074993.1 XdhC family protein [Ameyamaea chiangmaiensis]NVN41551.1 XdhC family protein [Ameyamaea chiangmaiensis]GBQ66013.1 xanthine dehydrogenase accessory factor XdhC/CoxI [Ameyamaea chiangmaiensis NBRC 103196]